jgi:hypothetical protein
MGCGQWWAFRNHGDGWPAEAQPFRNLNKVTAASLAPLPPNKHYRCRILSRPITTQQQPFETHATAQRIERPLHVRSAGAPSFLADRAAILHGGFQTSPS